MGDDATCERCGTDDDLWIVSTDLGDGPFLELLCGMCLARLTYRTKLIRRRLQKKEASVE